LPDVKTGEKRKKRLLVRRFKVKRRGTPKKFGKGKKEGGKKKKGKGNEVRPRDYGGKKWSCDRVFPRNAKGASLRKKGSAGSAEHWTARGKGGKEIAMVHPGPKTYKGGKSLLLGKGEGQDF